MIYPIQPTYQTQQIMPVDAFPGQKLENSKDLPRRIMIRKRRTTSAREEVPREQVEKLIEKLNRLMGMEDRKLELTVTEDENCYTIRIVDLNSGEELDGLTTQRLLSILKSEGLENGLFIDKRI